ncbi:MAG: hypothetical protein PUJ55_14130, partial [Clostridiales bacterium]|nr:hypothetical protein [Clostridiales bacterium]MDY4113400.1 hypothetical protein [Roseburia sp.]
QALEWVYLFTCPSFQTMGGFSYGKNKKTDFYGSFALCLVRKNDQKEMVFICATTAALFLLFLQESWFYYA